MAKKLVKDTKETRDAALSVLVGTFRKENAEWIKEKKFYNLPLPPCGKVAFHENISRVVLIADGFKSVAYEAKFREVVDVAWLKENGYKVAAADRVHGSAYALYELGEKLSFNATLSDPAADVFVSSQRCPNVKIDKEFYQKPYPKTGGKSMPYIFDKLKQYFKKWHSATTFNPVQLDFFSGLMGCKSKNKKQVKSDLRIISLFSGAGGLDIGFNQAGFKTAVMVEMDSACCKTLRKNEPDIPIIEGDLNTITTNQILKQGGLQPLEAALVIGGPPCQSFSLAGKRMGLNDPRGKLVLEFIRVVREALPVGFVMENVKGLINWAGGKALNAIVQEAVQPITYKGKVYKYDVKYQVLNAAEYGVPQFRERIFIVGNRIECDFEFPKKKYGPIGNMIGLPPYKTVRDAICDLPEATPPSATALRVSESIKGRIDKHGY